MYRITALFLLCASSRVNALWRDPIIKATLEITSHSTSLAVGDRANFTCTSHNFPLDTSTLFFTQQLGSNEEHGLYTRGRSPLDFVDVMQTYDHGTTLMCQSTFSEQNPLEYEDSWVFHTYYVRSPVVPIELIGGGISKLPAAGLAGLKISTDVPTTNLAVGDTVKVICETVNIPFGTLEVYQEKGEYSMKLHGSWQTYRELNITVSKEDDGTNLFCQVWLTDSSWNSYSILTERIPITVL